MDIELSTYDLDVQYRKGSDNGNADALSRPVVEQAPENDAGKLMAVNQDGGRSEIDVDSLRREQDLDLLLSEVKGWLTAGKLPPKKELRKRNRNLRTLARLFDQLTIEQGIMKLRRHDDSSDPVILLPRTYREAVLQMLHDDRTTGHLGTARTQEKVAARFFWPWMSKDVAHHCETCEACQRRSSPTLQMQASLYGPLFEAI